MFVAKIIICTSARETTLKNDSYSGINSQTLGFRFFTKTAPMILITHMTKIGLTLIKLLTFI